MHSSADVFSDFICLRTEDDFDHGRELTTVPKCEDDTHMSSLESQQANNAHQQCDRSSNTTFLSCTTDQPAKLSCLSLLASRVKALFNLGPANGIDDKIQHMMFNMAVDSTGLHKKCRQCLQGPDEIPHFELLITNIDIPVCLSLGHSTSKKSAKHSAHSNAVEVLQKPYLHLEEGSDKTLRLVGFERPLMKEKYDIVTRLEIPSDDLYSPVIDVISSSGQQTASHKTEQIVFDLKRLTTVVKTILHVLNLKTVRSNENLVTLATCAAEVPLTLKIDDKQHYYCCHLFMDTVLVAFAEGSSREVVKYIAYKDAIVVFCKPYLRLEASENSGFIRLVGSKNPFDKISMDTLPAQHNDDSDGFHLQEVCFSSKKELPSSACHNDVLPVLSGENCHAVSEECPDKHCPLVLLSTADLPAIPAIMSSFHRLSGEVKALYCYQSTMRSADVIMKMALQKTKLQMQTHLTSLGEGLGYRCDMHIRSVFVASGVARKKKDAQGEAYKNAAELLLRPCLRLAMDHDGSSSTMLVGFGEPFIGFQSPALLPQQTPKIGVSSTTIIDPIALPSPMAEAGDLNSMLAACTVNSVTSDADQNENCADDSTTTAEVALSLEQKQDVDACEIVNISDEMPSTMSSSTLPNHPPRVTGTDSKPYVEAESVGDSTDEQELPTTVVTARSKKDLSLLVSRFHMLAHMAKDVHRMFKTTKSAKNLLEMALDMSHMHSQIDVTKLEDGCASCKLKVDEVLLAVVEDVRGNRAQKIAFNIAFELLHMPYLCLEEANEAMQLIGSNEPFTDLSSEPYVLKVTSAVSSATTANAEDTQNVQEPLLTADVSKLVMHIDSFACRVKAVYRSALKAHSSIDIVQRALIGSEIDIESSVVRISDVGYRCELSTNGVLIAHHMAGKKNKARQATFNAAVEVLKKPYLWLQRDPKLSHSFKLIGSDQTFGGALSGILPCDFGRLESECSLEESQPISVTDTVSHLCKTVKTRVSSLMHSSMDVSGLLNQFHTIAQRVKCISKSSPLVQTATCIVETALAYAQMEKKQLLIWVSSNPFQCELTIDGVAIAHGEGDTKEQAKQAAYNAAVELLNKPYLQLQEKLETKLSYKLVGSDEPFVAGSPHDQNLLIAEKRYDQDKQPPDDLLMRQNATSPANENELSSQQRLAMLPTYSLTDFVILKNKSMKEKRVSFEILQQSADFNRWPISYNVIDVEGEYHCDLTLGGHLLGNGVGKGRNSARKAAAAQALKQLKSTCYSLQVKKEFHILTNTVTRNEILQGNVKDCGIGSDNIGYKLLAKMGWTGGSLDKNDDETKPRLPPVTRFHDRAGLGSVRPKPKVNFQSAVKCRISQFLHSGCRDDLVFSSELTSEERTVIVAEAEKNHLRCSFYQTDKGTYLILYLPRTPLALVNYLRQNGGQNNKYLLMEPSNVEL